MKNTHERLLQIHLFKTNIKGKEDKEQLAPIFKTIPEILRWSVDCEDCDCVLRIETLEVDESQIISTVQSLGFHCELLPD